MMKRTSSEAQPGVLLVGVSNPETADQLVALSSIVAADRSWEILLTHVVPVASQISLTTGRSSAEVVRARDFVEEVSARARAGGVSTVGLVEVARNVHEGLLAAARSNRAKMILVGYSEHEGVEADKDEERFDRAMHRVARKSKCPLIVAKFRNRDMRRVLVPVSATAPRAVMGMVCTALAQEEGKSLTFLHVAEPNASVEEARTRLVDLLETKGLASLGRVEVVSSEALVDRIVEEAAGYDLVIVGPSRRPGLFGAVLSSQAQRIAEQVPCSVLLVRSPRKQ